MAPTDEARERLPWSREVWERIDRAIADEAKRIKVAARFLPLHVLAEPALTAPAEAIAADDNGRFIDEALVTPLIETWIEFRLTAQQVEREADLGTACALAVRSANVLAQVQDALLFRGDAAPTADPLFARERIGFRSGPAGSGLSNWPLGEEQIVSVRPLARGEADLDPPLRDIDSQRFGDRTFESVAEGYARLHRRGHYGPYALVLPTRVFADAHAPLPQTQLMPVGRIRSLLGAVHLYGTSTLPATAGLLLSLGGASFDLVIGRLPRLRLLQQDVDGRFRFRVSERFAMRVREPGALIQLVFPAQAAEKR